MTGKLTHLCKRKKYALKFYMNCLFQKSNDEGLKEFYMRLSEAGKKEVVDW
jgi:hypothetical protein